MPNFDLLNSLLEEWDGKVEEKSFEDLPEGFYYCTVQSAVIKENKNDPNISQVSITFKVTGNGKAETLNERGYSVLSEIPNTDGRFVFKHYVLKDKAALMRFISDVSKFEDGEVEGSIYGDNPKEFFSDGDEFQNALDILTDLTIWVQTTKKSGKDGTTNTWYSLLSWDRANSLGLND